MARINLDQIRAMGDVTQTYRWLFNIVKAPTAVTFPTAAALDLRIETTELPKKTGQTVEVSLKGHIARYPGLYRPTGTLTFSFVETVDSVVAQWIADWRRACWADNLGTRAQKKDLEAVIQIQRLDNADEPIWQYTMKGCFPEDSNPGQLDGQSPDPLKPTLTVSYDDFTEGAL
jgi:hypothetical protein